MKPIRQPLASHSFSEILFQNTLSPTYLTRCLWRGDGVRVNHFETPQGRENRGIRTYSSEYYSANFPLASVTIFKQAFLTLLNYVQLK